jgi:hypothetical protein
MATKPKPKPKAAAKPKAVPKRRSRARPLPATVVKRGEAAPTPAAKRPGRRPSRRFDIEEARRRIRDYLLWELQSYTDRAPLESSERRLGAEQLLEDLERRDRLRREVIAAIDSALARMEAFAPLLLRVAPTRQMKVASEAAREHLGDARRVLAGIEDALSRWREMARTELSHGQRVLLGLGWPVRGGLPPHPMLQALAIQLRRLGMTEKQALAELLSFPAWTADFPHNVLDRIGDLAATWRACWEAAGQLSGTARPDPSEE